MIKEAKGRLEKFIAQLSLLKGLSVIYARDPYDPWRVGVQLFEAVSQQLPRWWCCWSRGARDVVAVFLLSVVLFSSPMCCLVVGVLLSAGLLVAVWC